MLCEHAHIADALADLVGIPALYKKPLKPVLTDIGLDAHGILAFTSFLNTLVAEIRSKNLDSDGYALLLNELDQSHCDGICLFSGGTRGYPNPNGISRGRVFHDSGKHSAFEYGVLLTIAKEARHANQQILKQGVNGIGMPAEMFRKILAAV